MIDEITNNMLGISFEN